MINIDPINSFQVIFSLKNKYENKVTNNNLNPCLYGSTFDRFSFITKTPDIYIILATIKEYNINLNSKMY